MHTKDSSAEIETSVASSTSDQITASPSNDVDASASALVKPAHAPSNDVVTSPSAIGVELLIEPTSSSLSIPAQSEASAKYKDAPTATLTEISTTTSTSSTTPKDSCMATLAKSPRSTALAAAVSLPIDSSNREIGTASQMDVDGNVGDITETVASPPAWLRNAHMSDYLWGVSKEKAWPLQSPIFGYL